MRPYRYTFPATEDEREIRRRLGVLGVAIAAAFRRLNDLAPVQVRA